MRNHQHQHRFAVSITMRTTTFVLLLVCTVGNHVSAAFQQVSSIGAHQKGASKTNPTTPTSINNVVIGDWRGKLSTSSPREKQTTTSLAMIDPTSMAATIVALASAAAAWQEYRTDKFQAYREITGRPLLFQDNKDTKVAVKEEKTSESSPTPTPKKSFVSKLNPLKAKRVPSPAPAKVEPVNVSKSAPAPAPKPLTLEVGNTVEKNREMNELGEKRRKEDEEKKASAAAEKEKKEVAAKAVAKTTTKKKGGFLRTSWRVVKKIVAPWRKWENIS
jgi:hypothetical protein